MEPQPDSEVELDVRRHRNADLVEEARIARAGGGVIRLSVFYQGLMYLTLFAALLVVFWWTWAS
jgi:hypothetical protein